MSSGSWTAQRRFSVPRLLPRLLPRRLLSLQTFGALVLVALLAGLGWLWYRDSSFVRINRVTVAGVSGQDAFQIRDALTQSALTMTTLDVQMSKLDASVSQYPAVHSLSVDSEGDHAVVIHVDEQIPVALVYLGGTGVVVDGNGRLLSQPTVPHGALPTMTLTSAPRDGQITAFRTLSVLSVLQAAPYQLLGHIKSATWNSSHGVVLQLLNGPQLYFGPRSQLAAKWVAVTAVLADKGSAGAAYIDVSDPARPAAGVAVANTSSGTTNNTSGTTNNTADSTTDNTAAGTTDGTSGDTTNGTTAGNTSSDTTGNGSTSDAGDAVPGT